VRNSEKNNVARRPRSGLSLRVEVMELVAELEKGPAPGEAHAEAFTQDGGQADSTAAAKEPDAAIVAAVLAGETQRFGELVRRYTEMVATFAFVRTRDRDLAEEIAQETMVRAYEKLWSLKVPRHFAGWLLGIAGNVALQAFERSKRQVGMDDEALVRLAAKAPQRPADEPSRNDLWQRILGEIDGLDPIYKVPFVMKHQEGLSCEEIAERLGMPTGTIRGRLSRAYGLLRRKLAAAEGRRG